MKIYGAISLGYESSLIDVECHVSNGLPGITIVGLANKAVDESKDRLRAAFASTKIDLPRKKILINLAPADIPKNDSSLDLAIAVSILCSGYAPKIKNALFIGELGLKGEIKPTKGLIGKLLEARAKGVGSVFVPMKSSSQAALVPGIDIFPLKSLDEAQQALRGVLPRKLDNTRVLPEKQASSLLINDVVGQQQAKRALVIAIAGRHNIHMFGPPGTGKTMLARAASQLLPTLDVEQSLEVNHLHSLAGYSTEKLISEPPFRAPHHSASDVSIIGGGASARPGEISLAHRGLLMLDELPEYSKKTLESLRQPLEDKVVVVSRAKLTTTYPADFMLVATSNPCPCGFYGTDKACSCSAYEIVKYQKRLSGPIMDRIDMHIQVDTIDPEHLLGSKKPVVTDYVKQIEDSSTLQMVRNKQVFNSQLSAKDLEKYGDLSVAAKKFMDEAARKMQLSSRGYLKCVRVARTIADLEGSAGIEMHHITESLQYRQRTSSN